MEKLTVEETKARTRAWKRSWAACNRKKIREGDPLQRIKYKAARVECQRKWRQKRKENLERIEASEGENITAFARRLRANPF